MLQSIPSSRVKTVNSKVLATNGDYILYWMIAARRPTDNFALQHALDFALKLKKPIMVFEPLKSTYRWASLRHHQFVIEGMKANQQAFESAGVTYLPYIETTKGEQKGLLEKLTQNACIVITDYFPSFFLPHMLQSAAQHLKRRLDVVDSNGILPLFTAPREFTTAASFRRHMQKNILQELQEMPQRNPLSLVRISARAKVSEKLLSKWPLDNLPTSPSATSSFLQKLPINQTVAPVAIRGGHEVANERWHHFLANCLDTYAEHRNKIVDHSTTGLSPYLHFGHISPHTIVRDILSRESWTQKSTAPKASGSRNGWWGLSPAAEALIDQVITWRELGYTFCHMRPYDYYLYESLPNWAQTTLNEHTSDPRDYTYEIQTLENAETHDPLWNAAQRQLNQEGRIHNYLRMLWGKKILEWTENPRVALQILTELNNKYAIDGRNPNSWSGIFWTLGRFDRAWGPERSIFGKVRYMSSVNTAKKMNVKDYLKKWNQSL